MTEFGPPMLVLASDYRVSDPARVLPLLRRRESALADIGAHHVTVYASISDPGRVLVMIWVRNRQPVIDLLRSRVFFDWFDAVGVTDIPVVFAGELVAEIGLTGAPIARAPEFVVAATTAIDDVPAVIEQVRGASGRLKGAGIRNIWVHGAFDDPREVLVLHQFDLERNARRWVERPDEVAQWMASDDLGIYPPVFVGRFVGVLRVNTTDGETD